MFIPTASLSAHTTEDQCREMLGQLNSPEAVGALAAKMGIEFTELSHDHVTGAVPVTDNTQPMGLFHGGGHVVLAESLASMHSFLISGGKNVVGVDLNATHLRAARDGTVTGRAEVLHQGRTIVSHEVKMTDAAGRLLSIVRITNMILKTEPK
ncbi:MAG: PaaI family thioesterase [Brevibacterium aurantiacum]|uniref:ComA operon protein 2 n=3 Tax=Brevibacterium TaxID=1696 RepID=A0A1D7W490_BREAU|nr:MULTISPECIES: PaaI family thioesterase [Brevibacterium]AOP53873.1 ComA operon protein 2 [Brevibacterium aurantiacum]AZL05983.1 PaaI family thioesterase [Brevibacterium aurantiacum]AZL09545.1 PaaI family thioesterase [Brevibacterium aurantiacum]AZL13179.1 PaaI family thioesterase [Brevibacterium aurantiacum]AZT93673.1 PaaI family thioesterase [Brevibacterium aurantiacum]